MTGMIQGIYLLKIHEVIPGMGNAGAEKDDFLIVFEVGRKSLLEQEFLTNPPNQQSPPTPRKFRIKGPDIVAIRLRFNLSQAAFARLIKIDRATLNRWEHSKVRPNQSSMAKIAEFRTMGKKEFARRMAQVEEAIWK
jgi:DNA-binding XRE family transcriptional regulator